MNQTYDNIISDLRDKFKKIINLYEVEKKKNLELESLKTEMSQKLEKLENERLDLQQKYQNLELAKNITDTVGGTHKAKLKVNRIVREIDKCIALLNR